MGVYSFAITTAHDLYCKLKREHTRFQGQTANSDFAWNCAVTAWHLREWVWKERLSIHPGEDVNLFGRTFRTSEEFYAELNRRCPNYKLMGDLCNGSKHFNLDRIGTVQSTTTKRGAMFDEAMFNEVAFNEGPYLEICLDDGSLVRFGDVLSQVVALWDDVFKNEPCP